MKKNVMLLLMIFAFAAATSCSDYMDGIADDTKHDTAVIDLNNGLVAYWPMNDNIHSDVSNQGKGSPITDYCQNNNLVASSTDVTSVGYDPTVNTAPGKYGTALQFDGQYSYIKGGFFDFLQSHNDLTVSFWIKDPTNSEPIIATEGFTIKCHENLSLSAIIKSTNTIVTYSAIWAKPGEWTFVTVTYDQKAIKIYINGVLATSGNCTGPILQIKNINIGTDMSPFEDESNGSPCLGAILDEFRIYNRALNENEIKALMNTGTN